MESYFATLPSGLEDLAAAEIGERGGEVLAASAGLVSFRAAGPPRALLALRTIERLCVAAGSREDLPRGAEAPAEAERWAAGLDWARAAEVWRAAQGASAEAPAAPPAAPPFRASVTRSGGEHAFRSPDLEVALGSGLRAQLPWPVQLKRPVATLRGVLRGEQLWVGLQLGGELSDARRALLGETALRPCVAQAMLRLAAPPPGSWVLDPLCGLGSIPAELAAWPGRGALAGDRDRQALACARRSLPGLGLPRLALARWDARRLPFASGSLTRIVSDLPFGRRVGSHRANRRLYPALLPELARVLAPGGGAVLLSGEVRLMSEALAGDERWELRGLRRIDLGGLEPGLYELSRR